MSRTVNLAGTRPSMYDLDDIQSRIWDQYGRSDNVAVVGPHTKSIVNTIIAPYNRDLDLNPNRVETRFGGIEFYTDPYMPEGQILFIDEDDFPAWNKAMKRSTLLYNIDTSLPDNA